MSLPDIRTLVPHAGQMVLLDSLVAADGETLCAEVRITADTLFCDGASVGAWVGIEYMAQAVAAFAGYEAQSRGEGVRVGFLLGSRKYEVTCPDFPVGSRLHVQTQRLLQGDNGLGAFDCKIVDANDAAGAILANATITVFQPSNVNEFLQQISDEGAV